ncbi:MULTISPECIES: ChuX/HutX family heme-like substrate-binding protein [unclassified Spirosoma]|uniref:hemin-degrading factor n=1 Tax=unclassified Spirosoma TaxID=2621999 RepID=UPI00096094FF|nr:MULTISPECIES: ChuX/HutX family heme-like substrate-binding protein [unclassified Spirosoma]MBN8823107.1 hemin-degrading factor [Spirosoma sp.]OJW73197.1 MAG: hemin-degrading factor [Spirosoma sp. 48-14]
MITAQSLKERWAIFKQENPKTRIRDAANQLGVSEAELVATQVGDTVQRLEGDFRELLKDVPTLGYVMALTRNDTIVHERKGVYEKISFKDQTGLVLGPDIDLRLFMSHWHFGFAVNENDRKSLQFFDQDGMAVHKIYMTDKSDSAAYEALVQKYLATDQTAPVVTVPYPEKTNDVNNADIDIQAFQADWLAMQDTHEFFSLLRKHKLEREQGLKLAPEGHAKQISVDQLKKLFETAAQRELPIMIFASSPGCIQIHTGPVKKLVSMGPWYNVLDPEFNMHLREDQINSIWVTRKPTKDGIVTGLDLFDKDGNTIALIFGKRKPGVPEMREWQNAVNEAIAA